MGIPKFFNHMRKNYPDAFTESPQKKYNYLILDYQSLFYNIKGLYEEVNYLIRLLYNERAMYSAPTSIPLIEKLPGGKFKRTHCYTVLQYVINTYKNLFTIKRDLVINEKNPDYFPKFMNIPKNDIMKQEQHNYLHSVITNLLTFFKSITEDDMINVIKQDIIMHTEILMRKHLENSIVINSKGVPVAMSLESKVYIYFDGIPSLAKVKEQLSRRVDITSKINKDIIRIGSYVMERDIRNNFLPMSFEIGIDTPIVNRTRDELRGKGYIVNDMMRYGEAEHQIMVDIAKNADGIFKKKSILLSSPDADLILLCMIQNNKYELVIDIYRENKISSDNITERMDIITRSGVRSVRKFDFNGSAACR